MSRLKPMQQRAVDEIVIRALGAWRWRARRTGALYETCSFIPSYFSGLEISYPSVVRSEYRPRRKLKRQILFWRKKNIERPWEVGILKTAQLLTGTEIQFCAISDDRNVLLRCDSQSRIYIEHHEGPEFSFFADSIDEAIYRLAYFTPGCTRFSGPRIIGELVERFDDDDPFFVLPSGRPGVLSIYRNEQYICEASDCDCPTCSDCK